MYKVWDRVKVTNKYKLYSDVKDKTGTITSIIPSYNFRNGYKGDKSIRFSSTKEAIYINFDDHPGTYGVYSHQDIELVEG